MLAVHNLVLAFLTFSPSGKRVFQIFDFFFFSSSVTISSLSLSFVSSPSWYGETAFFSIHLIQFFALIATVVRVSSPSKTVKVPKPKSLALRGLSLAYQPE